MAQSKKEQVNIKLAMAKSALESVITRITGELEGKTKEQIREDADLYKKHLALQSFTAQLAGIMRLFTTAKKKQGSRMILAVCHGELKSGELCLYKIRASMAMYLRGVPNCPDSFCKHYNKPLIVEIADDEIEQQVDLTLGEEIKEDIERQQKRAQEAQEKFGKKKSDADKDDSWLEEAGKL